MDDENDRPHYQTGTRASRNDFLKAWEQDRQFLKNEKKKKSCTSNVYIYVYVYVLWSRCRSTTSGDVSYTYWHLRLLPPAFSIPVQCLNQKKQVQLLAGLA